MSEIEKMYENCGIYPDCRARECGLDYCANSSGCGYAVYPDFTAEKQIELIKWLGKLAGKLEISSNYNDTQYLLYFYLNRKTRDEILPNISTGRSENFEESLAGLINSLWQDLTSEEKQQIKEILK